MRKEYIDYENLVFEKNQTGEFISYSEKLNTTEWQKKRFEIIERDNEKCMICNVRQSKFINGKAYINYTKEEETEFIENVQKGLKDYMAKIGITNYLPQEIEKPMHIDYQPNYLHVHHKYYIKNKLPWDYPTEALISLCKNCHQEIHDKEKIPVYENNLMETELDFKKCGKCNGSGYLPQYHYYMDGVCFQCNGNEFEENL